MKQINSNSIIIKKNILLRNLKSISLSFIINHIAMKLFDIPAVKKIRQYSLILVLAALVTPAFADNVVDSDLSNFAGTNAGHTQIGIYIFILLLLALAVFFAFRKKSS